MNKSYCFLGLPIRVVVIWMFLFTIIIVKCENFDEQVKYYHRNASAWMSYGNYDKALEYFELSKNLLEKNNAEYTGYYIKAITEIGKINYFKQDSISLKKTYTLIEKLVKENDIQSNLSDRAILLLRDIADFYIQTENIQVGTEILKRLKTMCENTENLETKANVLHSLALAYSFDNIAEAIKFEREAIKICESPEFYKCLSWYYHKASDYVTLDSEIEQAFIINREESLWNLVRKNSKERADYWTNSGIFFNRVIPLFAFKYPTGNITSVAYDAALLSKGMLLNAEISLSSMVMEMGDDEIIKNYMLLKQLKSNSFPTLEEEAKIYKLQNLMNDFQKKHENKFKNKFRYSWKDIQNSLKENALAIEFILAEDENLNQIYMALAIDNKCDNPILIPLFNYSDISSIPVETFYSTSDLYNVIWKPIFSQFPDVKEINFSPIGVLNNIAIEYCEDEDGIELSSFIKLNRLSSTKRIFESKNSVDFKDYFLIGGANFNSPDEHFESISENGVSYLPGTKDEVDSIKKILLRGNNNITYLVGNEASEKNLRYFSNLPNDIFHIATHGFYFNQPQRATSLRLSDMIYYSLFSNTEDERNFQTDFNLSQSGLLLAGVNNTLNKTEVKSPEEDGILYANEVSSFNLNQVSVAVLSACDSALGDLSLSEGIFGLQRGFKLGGVETIIMSLWKINDEATKIFMCNLYERLNEGLSIYDAFYNARLDLRESQNGKWDKPEYYNAFILLDPSF